MIIPKKTPMAEQPPEVRSRNFKEVTYGYTAEEAVLEAMRCLECKKPICVTGCPVGVDIPGFIRLIKAGDFAGALSLIKLTNTLPAICGRVCPQESQCEGVCTLAKKYEPVAVGRLERFVADWEVAQNPGVGCEAFKNGPPSEPTGKRVAVVGSGPSGLTVAADLARMGHMVTVFEALHEAGGVLMYGIPEFRLPKAIVQREIEYVTCLGVEIRKDFVVGMTATIDELLAEYDAVFIGSGAGLPWFLNIPGENMSGIYSANEYLTRTNLMKAYQFPEYDTPVARGLRVVTIGGGNTAMDAARTALRLGAQESVIVYRRSLAEMPARAEEIHHAQQEGVRFQLLTAPIEFHGDGGRLAALECQLNQLGEPDASGRRRPVPIEGSNFMIEADVAIVAIGASPSPIIPQTTPDLAVRKGGIVIADPDSMKTSKKGVFAGGDLVTGGATVIVAMGQGKIAAMAIDEYLRIGTW